MRLIFLLLIILTPLIAEATTKTKTIGVVLVQLPGFEVGLNENDAKLLFWGSSGVASAFNDYSFGKLSLKQPSKAVLGPITIVPTKGENCDKSYRAWSQRALELLGKQSEKVIDYDHIVFIFPPAEVLGCSARARGELFGSFSWIFGASVNTIVHELGHNLGLGHAAASESDNSITEYGDDSSPMGYTSSQSIFFNAPQLLQLKWINQNSVYNISQAGNYQASLFPLESYTASGTQQFYFLSIQTPAPRKNFLVSYRKIPNPMLGKMRLFQKGASIHLNRGLGKSSILVATLSDGQIFFDPDTGLKIIPKSHSAASVELEVKLPAGERFDLPISTTAPLHDIDNDGVENEIDCAQQDSARWNSAISIDSDHDGLPDSLTPVNACFGTTLPQGYAEIGSVIDNCPTLDSKNIADTNWDGLGDVCSETSSIKKHKAEAMLRQAAINLSYISQKTEQNILSKLTSSSLYLVSESLKFYQKEPELSAIRNNLKSARRNQTALKSLKKLIKRLGISNPSRPSMNVAHLQIRKLPCKLTKVKARPSQL